MAQILVTVEDNAPIANIKKAFSLVRGVISVKTTGMTKKESQEKYVKETLEMAFKELKEEREGKIKLKTLDEVLKEIEADGHGG